MLRRMLATLTPRGRATACVALLLSVVGAALAIVLLREHLTVFQADVATGLFCDGSGRFDCNRVAASPQSWWAGLPVAMWGFLFYVTMAVLAIDALTLPPGERAAAAAAGTVLALTALVLDAWLLWQMLTQIGAVCLNCIASYAINVALLVTFWLLDQSSGAADWNAWALGWWPLVAKRPVADDAVADVRPGRLGKLAVALVGAATIVVTFVLTARSVASTRADALAEAVEFLNRSATERPIDMTHFAGLPSQGPANAKVTIVVASDFECNFCRALSAGLDQIRALHPDDVRVIYLNAPLSSLCNPRIKSNLHPNACWLAKAGICAAKEGKFWEYHDLVNREIPFVQVNSLNVRAHLPAIGISADSIARCMESAETDSVLARDVRLWRELGMESVPSLVINGHLKPGGIYPSALRAIVNALLTPPS